MKKLVIVGAISLLVAATAPSTTPVHAAGIKIVVDGVQVQTDQSPVMRDNRVLVPLRAIFESLNAHVSWNEKEQLVTAKKGSTTIKLRLHSQYASINDLSVMLDVPATTVNDRTVVPIRFVSEALGADVDWNDNLQQVTVKSRQVDSPSQVQTWLNTQSGSGTGSDISVSFTRSNDESLIDHYRVMVVPLDGRASLTLDLAKQVQASRYISVPATGGAQPSLSLSANTQDVSGNLLKGDQAYAIYVLAVGNQQARYGYSLSPASAAITIPGKPAVAQAGKPQISDVSDYGDGRDFKISFNKASTDSDISNYRVILVKSKDTSGFNLDKALSLPTTSYVTVNKSGNTLSTQLHANVRDSSGELLSNGVSYTAYVVSVSSQSKNKISRLSEPSTALTLSDNIPVTAPTITKVADVSDYGDGRDVQVTFMRSTDESKISSYRLYAVQSRQASSFTAQQALQLSSDYYVEIYRSGTDVINQQLHMLSKDTQGKKIVNGQAYQFFVLAVGNDRGGYQNALSKPSDALTLKANFSILAPHSVKVADVSDFNDGRDLQVSFNRSSDETNIIYYRLFVVKAANAGQFDLTRANAVSMENSTLVYKTGATTLSQKLSADAKDVDGAAIRNGVNYQVFVMAVNANAGNYSEFNALSRSSDTVVLSQNAIAPVSAVTTRVNNQYGDGRDIELSFTRSATELMLNEYRAFIVRSDQAASFEANPAALTASRYMKISTGLNDYRVLLGQHAKDINGTDLLRGIPYRIYVQSVPNSRYSQISALSSASNDFVLQESTVASSWITSLVDASVGGQPAINMQFTKSASEAGVAYYAVMVVPTSRADNFTLETANSLNASRYTIVGKTGYDLSINLPAGTQDVDGNPLLLGGRYKLFVLTIADGRFAAVNNLSQASAEITLNGAR